eukprot:TRINITY_DN2304_c0_g1_i1.p1 TRINITY_DN2304_c0_g1~~TRINITY_DN2304_c0_g1_i1.p1  ORF type:complete len:195 (+),score=38.06 TRINITY_DN2304_c0_g1_i1:48-632(+)
MSQNKRSLQFKIGLLGNMQAGKTTLMVKYVQNRFDSSYIATLGVNFMEKAVTLKNAVINFSIWDLGGSKDFSQMLPLVVSEAHALLFLFDLTNKSSLWAIKEWYYQARGHNRTAIPILVGTKYDLFCELSTEEQAEVTTLARKYAAAMKAPIIFCSSAVGVNVNKIFKIALSKVFQIPINVPKVLEPGQPIIDY